MGRGTSASGMGSGAAATLTPHWKGRDQGCGMGGCPAPCPLSPNMTEGPWAAPCRKFGFVRGPFACRVHQPCCGAGTRWVAQASTGSAWPWAREPQGWVFAWSWGGLPHPLSLQNTSRINAPSQSSHELNQGCRCVKSHECCYGIAQLGPVLSTGFELRRV